MEELYKQCFEAYYEKLYGYAFTIVKDNAETKDIVQSAFIKLWEKRNEVNIQHSGRSYLYTTVYHLALNSIRNRKTKEGHLDHLRPVENTETMYSGEEKETRERIQNEIDLLPPKCREVFNKSRFEGKKYAEIAAEMNISNKTVEAQMGKALKIMRQRLADLLMLIAALFFK